MIKSTSRYTRTSIMVMLALLVFMSQSLVMAQSQSAEVEITGTLTSITTNSIVVGSETFDISHAEVKAGVVVGQLIKVHASKNAAGIWIAREVEAVTTSAATTPSPNATPIPSTEFEIRGVITAINGSSITVSGRIIDISKAEIKNTIAVNDSVKVHLTLINNQWVAREVDLAAPQLQVTVTIPANCIPAQPAGWTTYTVQAGDSLSSIAAGSGSSVQDIAVANCISNARNLQVGQSIFVLRQPVMVPTNRGGNDDGPNHDLNDDHGGQNGSSDDHGSHSGSDDQQPDDNNNNRHGSDDNGNSGSSGSDDNGNHGGGSSGHG